MVKRLVTDTNILLQAIQQASRNGSIEYESLQQLIARQDWQYQKERTPFDIADEQNQVGSFPPTGRWENSPQAKDTQEAHSDV